MSVSVSNRRSSYFNITLDICDSPDNIAGVYTLQVANEFGMDSSAAIEIQGKTDIVFPVHIYDGQLLQGDFSNNFNGPDNYVFKPFKVN